MRTIRLSSLGAFRAARGKMRGGGWRPPQGGRGCLLAHTSRVLTCACALRGAWAPAVHWFQKPAARGRKPGGGRCGFGAKPRFAQPAAKQVARGAETPAAETQIQQRQKRHQAQCKPNGCETGTHLFSLQTPLIVGEVCGGFQAQRPDTRLLPSRQQTPAPRSRAQSEAAGLTDQSRAAARPPAARPKIVGTRGGARGDAKGGPEGRRAGGAGALESAALP